MTPAVRYPSGPIVPHGIYRVLKGDVPVVRLRAYDDSVLFDLMGGPSLFDRTMPERVEIKDLKGLVPPWKPISQKGATQDGETFVTALYNKTEVDLTVVVRGRDPIWTRKVKRHLIDSIDAIKTSELSWFTQDMGRWWAPIRWMAAPADPEGGIQTNRQVLSLRLAAYDAFWRSYDCVTSFGLTYETALDAFADLSAWTIAYSGAGSGTLSASGGQVTSTLANGHTAVARRTGYTSTTDNQVITVDMGTLPQYFYADDAELDIWARMKNTGTAGSDGVRLRLGDDTITLSTFNSGIETVMRQVQYPLTIPPRAGERWTFIVGTPTDSRTYKLLRNGALAMAFKETGTGSQLGSTFRSAGFGLHSDDATVIPPGVRRWAAGDNTAKTQSGFVQLKNVGDQQMFERFTCVGPGTFSFGNGPGATDMVALGPLLENQIAQIRTDPGKRGVVDMSVVPVNPQDAAASQGALADFTSFLSGSLLGPVESVLQSIFGIFGGGSAPVLPQGNLYSLLKGRFSDAAAIPAKSPGNPAQPYSIAVKIEGGTADSLIIAAGTPLRRRPD
jgi:hypothetical protein